MHVQRPDFTYVGSARAIGLDPKHEDPPGSHRFVIPETTLGALAADVQRRTGARALRVVGDPKAKVSRIRLGVGYASPPINAADIDVLISGEQQESDGSFDSQPYALDAVTLGIAKGIILLGHTISEEAGMLEMAAVDQGLRPRDPGAARQGRRAAVGPAAALTRCRFLESAALGLPLLGSTAWGAVDSRAIAPASSPPTSSSSAAGSAGARRRSRRCARRADGSILTEETDWIGGQLTSQAVPPDEHPWIEQFGCTRTLPRTSATASATTTADTTRSPPRPRADPHLNPGNGSVSRLCHEPRVALAVLDEMLAPYRQRRAAARAAASTCRSRPTSTAIGCARSRCSDLRDRRRDASLDGPVLPRRDRAGRPAAADRTEYVTGAESRTRDRRAARARARRSRNQQAFTCCFAMDYLRGEDHTIDRPAEYDFWRDYVPAADAGLAGQAAELGDDRPAARSSDAHGRRSTRLARTPDRLNLLDLPPHRRPAQLPAAARIRGDIYAGELAAERLLARAALGSTPDEAARHLAARPGS